MLPAPSGIVIISPRTAQEMAAKDWSLWIPKLGAPSAKQTWLQNPSLSWMMFPLKPRIDTFHRCNWGFSIARFDSQRVNGAIITHKLGEGVDWGHKDAQVVTTIAGDLDEKNAKGSCWRRLVKS